MNKKSIYNRIESEYQKDRFAAAKREEERKKQIYSIFPRIAEIDSLIEKNGLELINSVFAVKGKEEREEFTEKIKVENEALIAEKNYILENNGFEKDYMTNVYKCPKCRDSGRVGTEKCSCYNERLMKKLYDVSNLKNKTDKENFEHFDFSFYSDKKEESEKLSPLENINNIYKICSKFVKDFESKHMNLIFYGGAGLGKTFLCSCIARELIEKGKIVVYVSAFELFDMIEREHFGKNRSEEVYDSLELIENAQLLIIDDLGTEFATNLSVTELFNIINHRLNNEMSTIISTNLAPKELERQYSDRLISRIYGNYTLLRFIGEDIRIQKKMRK